MNASNVLGTALVLALALATRRHKSSTLCELHAFAQTFFDASSSTAIDTPASSARQRMRCASRARPNATVASSTTRMRFELTDD
jgi:hypothetical protein